MGKKCNYKTKLIKTFPDVHNEWFKSNQKEVCSIVEKWVNFIKKTYGDSCFQLASFTVSAKAGVDLKLISLAKILGVTQDSNEIQKRQLNSD
ncbi:20373_t:CDS:2 [Entrophospora sp. SA101]|nr:20373_t:CDS:2 [Entrophospora sp. SA101]